MATRLRDRWEHLFQKATEENPAGEFESYEEWLARIGCTEADDDLGIYGDATPTWLNETIKPRSGGQNCQEEL